MRSANYFWGVLDWMIIFQWFIACLLQNVVGGRQCKRPVKAFEMYDADTRSWTSLPMLSCKRSYGGVLWDHAGRLCLLGGLRQGGAHQTSKFTNNVNIFDCTRGTDDRKSNRHISLQMNRVIHWRLPQGFSNRRSRRSFESLLDLTRFNRQVWFHLEKNAILRIPSIYLSWFCFY